MATNRPEGEIGKMEEINDQDMIWNEDENTIRSEGEEKSEKDSVEDKNPTSENKNSLQDLSQTGEKDRKTKLGNEILANNETIHERKHVANIVVMEGAKRRKTISDEPMGEPAALDEDANEVEDKEPKKHVEPSIKIEKKLMIGAKILGKQKATTQLKLSQTKMNFKRIEEFNEIKTPEKKALKGENVDEEEKWDVSRHTNDEEIQSQSLDVLLQVVQRWWKLNGIKPDPIKVSKHSLVAQVINIRNSVKADYVAEERKQESEMQESEDESLNLSEIEGETNVWLDDLEEWETKIVQRFKDANSVEATETEKKCKEERRMNVLLRAVQFEANTVKKELYSGGKTNEFDPNFVKSYIAWYQNHDEYYLQWDELDEMEEENITEILLKMVQPTKIVNENGSISHVSNKILSPREINARREYSGPIVKRKAMKFTSDEYKKYWKNIEVETNAAIMSKGIEEFAKRVKLDSLKVKPYTHVEKIAAAYWNQDDDEYYKTHGDLEMLKMEEIDTVLNGMRKNQLLEEDVEKFSDMEIEYQNGSKNNMNEDQENIECMRDVEMKDVRSENLSNEIKIEEIPEKEIDPTSGGKKIVENQRKLYEASKSQPTMENYTTNKKKPNIGGLTVVTKKENTHELGIHVKMMASKTVAAKSVKFDKNKPPPLNQEEVLATKEVTPLLNERTITARFNLGNENVKDKVNIPIIARQIFRIFKEADRTIRLLPFFSQENEDIETIDQEQGIPTEESKLKQWVDNPHFIGKRLVFAMRVTTIATMKHIQDTFYMWMRLNKSFVKMDELNAREVYGIGCIINVHSTFHNRYRLKRFIQNELKKKGFMSDINMYTRNVWNRAAGGDQISTRAIVIEVDKAQKDKAIDAMIAIDLTSGYERAKFIRFHKSQFSDTIMSNIFSQNNTYHNETRKRKIEGLHGIYEIKDRCDGRLASIWIESYRLGNNRLIEMVEENVYGETVVLYRASHEKEVNGFLETTNLMRVFTDPTTKEMTRTVYVPSLVTESESRKSYTNALIKSFSNNPQDGDTPVLSTPIVKNRIYYGNTKGPAKKMLYNHNMMKNEIKADNNEKKKASKVESTILQSLNEIRTNKNRWKRILKRKLIK